MRFAIAAIFAASLAGAQTGRIEGRVVTPDGRPVPRATVRLTSIGPSNLQPPPVYVEVTAADGSFVAEGLEPGSYRGMAERLGYAPQAAFLQIRDLIQVAAGARVTGVEIQLTPLATLSGVVVDAQGEPVPGISVRLLRRTFQPSGQGLMPFGSVTTDAGGRFHSGYLQPGRYYLQAIVEARPSPSLQREIRGPSARITDYPTFYPSALALGDALALEVGSSPLEGLRIEMQRGPAFTISGRLAGPVAQGYLVQVVPQGGAPAMNAAQAMSTTTEFRTGPLPPGTYTLYVQAGLTGRVEVTIQNADVTGVTIPLQLPFEVTGRVRIEGVADFASFLAGLNATRGVTFGPGGASPQTPQSSVALMPADPLGGFNRNGTLRPDGSFTIAGVAPSRYTLSLLSPPPNFYIKRLMRDGQNITGQVLDLTGSSTAELELVLATGSTLSLRLDRQEPTALSAWPVSRDVSHYLGGVRNSTMTGSEVRFTGLAPGDYYAVRWEENPPPELQLSPDFLERFNSLATRVTVPENGNATITPAVISAEALRQALAEFR